MSQPPDLTRRCLAEAIGTFVLVLCGVGAAVLGGDALGQTGIALAFGLSLLVMVYAIGSISGCHINPAVTVGLLLARRISARDAGGYVIAQVVGAVLAAIVVAVVAKAAPEGYSIASSGLGANGYGAHSPGGYGLAAVAAMEVVMTALLVLVVLAATNRRATPAVAGLPIGLVLVLIHLVSIPISNTSVNPARSIGPALMSGGGWPLGQLWIFVLAPLVGGAIAAALYGVLQPEEREEIATDAA